VRRKCKRMRGQSIDIPKAAVSHRGMRTRVLQFVGVLTLLPGMLCAEEQHPRLLATPPVLEAIRAEIRKPGSHHQRSERGQPLAYDIVVRCPTPAVLLARPGTARRATS
jgi:hypothetical protein